MGIVRTCAACGQHNRVPVRHAADAGRCGKCKAALPPLAEPLEVDAATFEEVRASAQVPVLVDFWAGWCGPCRMAAPQVKRLAEEMRGRALVVKVDTERHPELAQAYDVHGIPNFVVLRGGRKVSQHAGLTDAREMRRWLEAAA